jgi:hypothetical protein
VTDNANHADAEIDARLSEWGRASRAAAQPVAVPASLMAAAAPARRSTVVLRIGAGVAMAAIVVATVIGLPRYLHLDRTAAPSIGGVTSTATARPGFQTVTFHGLSITVPSSWTVPNSWLTHGGEDCSLSREYVGLPGARLQCGSTDTPSIAFVEFIEGDDPLGLTGPIKITKTRISGIAATRTDGLWAARAAFGYTVPTLRASVLIVPAQGQTGADLAGSLQVNAFDSHGCPAAVADVAELPRNKPPAREGAADTLIPGRPTVLRVCRYVLGRIEQGTALTGPQATGLVTVLAHLPPGLNRADPDTFSPELCHTSAGDVNTIAGNDVASDGEAYRIQADYPVGKPVVVVVRLGLCGDLGASNGSRTGQRTDALVKAVTDLVRNTGGISPLLPVR